MIICYCKVDIYPIAFGLLKTGRAGRQPTRGQIAETKSSLWHTLIATCDDTPYSFQHSFVMNFRDFMFNNHSNQSLEFDKADLCCSDHVNFTDL